MSEIITRGNFLKGGIATILASGVAPSILMADSRSAGSIGGLRRGLGARMGMMGGKSLPYDYEVEYLETNSPNNFIKTGILASAGAYEVDVMYNADQGESDLFGNAQNYGTATPGFWIVGNYDYFIFLYSRKIARIDSAQFSGTVRKTIKASFASGIKSLYINGALIGSNATQDPEAYPLCLFCGGQWGNYQEHNTGDPVNGLGWGRIYSVRVNGSRRMIPVVRDGIGEMYDVELGIVAERHGIFSVGPRK